MANNHITTHGRNLLCTTENIEITKIAELKGATRRDFKNNCIPLETPIVIKNGGSYTLLSDPGKFKLDIVSMEAKTLRCAVLDNQYAHPEFTTPLKALLSSLPPSPLQYDLSVCATRIQACPQAINWLSQSYSKLFKGNAQATALIHLTMGGDDIISKKTIRNHKPNKPKTAIECWNEKAKQNSGLSYKKILELSPADKRREFISGVAGSLKDNSFNEFFGKVQVWAQQKTGNSTHV